MQSYLQYVENTEPPVIFHRWSLLTAVGALLERNVYYGQDYFTHYPNLYVMLLGESGTRKSTAINLAKKTLAATGYSSFSAEKTSKEKYLQDLADQHEELQNDITFAELFGDSTEGQDTRVTPNFIVAGEFNDFIGNGNIEFMSILGNLWDWNGGPYENRIKTGKSIKVPNPTISLLGGNTATGLNLAFPPHAIGQGFFSRLIFVHSAASQRRIRNPIFPTTDIASMLREVKQRVGGKLESTITAERLLDAIYERTKPISDTRFSSYSTRRYTQLIKLIIIITAMDLSTTVTEDHVLLANTILCHAEQLMPTGLGEFGRSRNSEVAHSMMQFIISNRLRITTPQDLWEKFSQDLENASQMHDLLHKLVSGGKIIMRTIEMDGHKITGFLGVNNAITIEESTSEFVDFNLLTQEEREMKK